MCAVQTGAGVAYACSRSVTLLLVSVLVGRSSPSSVIYVCVCLQREVNQQLGKSLKSSAATVQAAAAKYDDGSMNPNGEQALLAALDRIAVILSQFNVHDTNLLPADSSDSFRAVVEAKTRVIMVSADAPEGRADIVTLALRCLLTAGLWQFSGIADVAMAGRVASADKVRPLSCSTTWIRTFSDGPIGLQLLDRLHPLPTSHCVSDCAVGLVLVALQENMMAVRDQVVESATAALRCGPERDDDTEEMFW